MKKQHILFSREEDEFIKAGVSVYHTVYDLTDAFNASFPNHPTTRSNVQARMQKLGIRKGTHNIRQHKVHSVNPIGTIIRTAGHSPRVKTESGYVCAHKYFKDKYFPNQEGMLIHLNGDYLNFDRSNIELVTKSIYSSLHWRKWIFVDPELTKTAILVARLLEYFPEYLHNENQVLRIKRID